LLLVGVGVVAVADNAADQVAQAGSGQVCFPAESWDADQADRPCAHVVKVWEDGSVRVVVTDARGTYRYTSTTGARDR
jgi:hypothetical protein